MVRVELTPPPNKPWVPKWWESAILVAMVLAILAMVIPAIIFTWHDWGDLVIKGVQESINFWRQLL